jgi:hypothetical protein
MHALAPRVLYVPTLHSPVQSELVIPSTAPKRPALQPVHPALDPVVVPYVPAGHRVQLLAPAANLPRGHGNRTLAVNPTDVPAPPVEYTRVRRPA